MRKQPILSEAEIDAILMTIPSVNKRADMMTHLAVTGAWLAERNMPQVPAGNLDQAKQDVEQVRHEAVQDTRSQIAAWLTQQAVLAPIAKLIEAGRFSDTPPRLVSPEDFAALEAEVSRLSAENTTLRAKPLETVTTPAATHPKPWAVRRTGGKLQYFGSRKEAREAQGPGEIVVDCR